MIMHIVLAALGLSLAVSASTFALALARGGVWRWADEDGVHVMTGAHPPNATRVAPRPLWYVVCAGVVPLGVLLALRQLPPLEKWTGRVFDIYITGFIGLATSVAGVYMIV